MQTPEDIAGWHHFCQSHQNKKLQGTQHRAKFIESRDFVLSLTWLVFIDWYKHKVQYPWLLPGFNETLSRFPPGFWSKSPNHSNLVESGHVQTNLETGIRLTPLEAIES